MAERVRFASSTGPVLAGLVDIPLGEVRGWECSPMDSPSAKTARPPAGSANNSPATASACCASTTSGWAIPKATGVTARSHKVEDTVRAVEFMNNSGREVRLLVGHSFGGSAVIAAAHHCPSVAAVASIGAPLRTRSRRAQLRRPGPPHRGGRRSHVPRRGKALTLKRHFIEDIRAADLRERIRTLHRALLIMHSPTDNTVGIENASDIFRTARHPRSFVSLEGADHLLTGKNQAARAARIINAWADPTCDSGCGFGGCASWRPVGLSGRVGRRGMRPGRSPCWSWGFGRRPVDLHRTASLPAGATALAVGAGMFNCGGPRSQHCEILAISGATDRTATARGHTRSGKTVRGLGRFRGMVIRDEPSICHQWLSPPCGSSRRSGGGFGE